MFLKTLFKRNFKIFYVPNRNSMFCNIELGPPDPILGLNAAFRADKNKKKVNLGVGAYRDDEGNPFVLLSVRRAEEAIFKAKLNHEYAPIDGEKTFTYLAIKLALSACSPYLQEGRCATVQSISGTGALRIGAAFLCKFWEGNKVIYVPNPTWTNHYQIFRHAGLEIKKYQYYDPETVALNLKCFFEDLNNIPEKSIILLHACAHNPTGIDPTCEQWKEMINCIKARKLLPFFDMAYQGFASGDPGKDANAVRMCVDNNMNFLLAQSFAKNMGLYGERVGAFTVACGDKDEAERVSSQLKIIIRGIYSSPPIFGSRIVTKILSEESLYRMWLRDLEIMSKRIMSMRKELKGSLIKCGSKRKWDHITNQIGMFCYTGIGPEEVKKLIKDYHIYLTKDGRISVAGVNSKNVEYLAKAMHDVTKGK